jgi:acetyl-CoA carboxylase biotin carboxylase subunit
VLRKVLVANRGEIAVRILRTLREMGVTGAAVYSDVDRTALHVLEADEAYPLPGVSAADTYLNQRVLLEIIQTHGVEGVHPGYGFLSENPGFAAALEAAGVTLVGPPAAAMEAMGDKIEAKRRMRAAGVPVVPGWEGEADDNAALLRAAEDLGYPVLVKAAAGGGGRGMRRVEAPGKLSEAAEAAGREAQQAFGDPRIFLEKYLERPRHVEVQVFGDNHGRVVHLFERECSIQRRHQKIIEEAPSPALTPKLRAAMGRAAVEAARTIDYRNAGTVEFMLDANGAFYFLEMNTRLQVEHPVTELITGRDLVRDQVRVAAGEPLGYRQEDLRMSGHALECRIYAEDPAHGFLPSTGRLQVYREPQGPGVRVDSGFREGDEVTPHYDPLLAKLVVWAETRPAAIARMERALGQYAILGVETNIAFLLEVIRHPSFQAGALHTGFLDEHNIAPAPGRDGVIAEALAAAAAVLTRPAAAGSARGGSREATPSPWRSGGAWRLS